MRKSNTATALRIGVYALGGIGLILGLLLVLSVSAKGPSLSGGAETVVAPTIPIRPRLHLPLITRSGGNVTELKYALLAEFPDMFYCDPDFYPVARDDEMELARQCFRELRANAEEFLAILEHHGLTWRDTYGDDEMLLIYREHKRQAAIQLVVEGDAYRFQLRTGEREGQGFLVTGRIDRRGAISGVQRECTITTCPICLAGRTLIDAPAGAMPVEELQVGDLVWTADALGAPLAARVGAIGRALAPEGHRMVHLAFDDGRELWASLGHPTADGRTLGELRPGDALDKGLVVFAERAPYDQPLTYDLLPEGPTGAYWANGILVGSTLKPR